MKSTPIYTNKKGKTLVKLEKENWTEWVVCRNYDNTKEEGNKWDYGIYFENFVDAVRVMTNSISYLIWIVTTEEDDYKRIKICETKEDAINCANTCIKENTGKNENPKKLEQTLKWEDPENNIFIYIREYNVFENKWNEVGNAYGFGSLFLEQVEM